MEAQKTTGDKLRGKELILATKPYAREIRSKSWFYMLTTLAALACSALAIYIIPWLLLKGVFSILTGLLMVRMFAIYHDYQHHAILHRSRVSNIIMTAYGLLVLVPSSIWKRSHDYHHNHNSKLFSASIGSYPIATVSKFRSMAGGERRLYLFTRHPLTIMFGYLFMFIIGMCMGSFLSSPRRHADSLVALILHFGLSALVVTQLGWTAWLFGMFIPFFIASAIGAYLFYAQHNFPGVTFRGNEDWKYEISAMESSSYMVMSPFMRWMTANIGYHHIHHLNSRIPFYRLPEAMQAIPELQHAKTTSLSPLEIVRCFRLKVWDPERNRMIALSEIRAGRQSG